MEKDPPGTPTRPAWPRPSRVHRWIGPAGALVLAVLLLLLGRWDGPRIPNPNLLFAMILVLGGYLGGIPSGLASAGIAIAFTAYDWSIPGHFLSYSPKDFSRMLVVLAAMPSMALLVGLLKARADALHRTIARYLALEKERNRTLALALGQLDRPQEGLSVCAWCHKVREADGRWIPMEEHLAARHGTSITHGICPECRPAFIQDIPRAGP